MLDGYGSVSEETSQSHPVILRLSGSHVLAGLRTLVSTGMDEPLSPGDEEEQDSAGLPTWLTEIRTTRATIGADGNAQS